MCIRDSDRRDQGAVDPGGLQRLHGTHTGRLVGAEHDVDVGVAGQAVLHRRTAAVLGAVGRLVAGDFVRASGVVAGLRLVTVLLRVLDVDPHAGEEALVALVVDGHDLVGEQVQHRDHRGLALQGLGRPLADLLTGLEVVRRERGVHDVRRVRRRIEGDHVDPGVARLLDRVVDGGPVVRDQDAVVAPGDRVFDRLDLAVGVGLVAAGGDRDVGVHFLRRGLRPIHHRGPEVVTRVLGDEKDVRLARLAARARGRVVVAVRRTPAGGERRDGQAGGDSTETLAPRLHGGGTHHSSLQSGTGQRPVHSATDLSEVGASLNTSATSVQYL